MEVLEWFGMGNSTGLLRGARTVLWQVLHAGEACSCQLSWPWWGPTDSSGVWGAYLLLWHRAACWGDSLAAFHTRFKLHHGA